MPSIERVRTTAACLAGCVGLCVSVALLLWSGSPITQDGTDSILFFAAVLAVPVLCVAATACLFSCYELVTTGADAAGKQSAVDRAATGSHLVLVSVRARAQVYCT